MKPSQSRVEDAEYDAKKGADDLYGRKGSQFYVEEADDTNTFKRLSALQERCDDRQEHREGRRRRDTELWLSRLEYVDAQKERVHHLTEEVDYCELNGYPWGWEEAVLAIIFSVGHADGRDLLELTSVDGSDVEAKAVDPQFREILAAMQIDPGTVMVVHEILRESIESVSDKTLPFIGL